MKIYVIIIAFLIFEIASAQKVWSFNDCLSYARENNLQVIASKLNEQVQESNYKIAKNQKLPDLTSTIGNDFTFGPTYKQSINLEELTISSRYKYTEGYQNNLAIQSSILLYNNGNLKLTEQKNSLLLKQYQFTTEKIKNDISLQLVGNYLTVLLNKELMIVNKNSLDTYQQQFDRNQKLYNAGSIPLSTLYESKANLADAKQTYENSIIEVDRSLMVLAMLLQKDYRDFDIESVKVSNNISTPLVNIDDVIQYAYQNQPEIKSVELGIEAAKKDIDIAKTALYPSITGGYKASTYYQDYFDRASKSLNDQWYDNHAQMLSVGLNIPIFNKGISKLQIEQSKIKQIIQENQLDQEKLTLKQNIQTSYFDVNSSYQNFLSSKESVESNQLSYEYAQKSFAAGKLNVYDLNIARNNFFSAQSQMLQSKYSFLFRLKILDFYTGKPLQITSDEDLSNFNYENIKSADVSETATATEITEDTNTTVTTPVALPLSDEKQQEPRIKSQIPPKEEIKNIETPILKDTIIIAVPESKPEVLVPDNKGEENKSAPIIKTPAEEIKPAEKQESISTEIVNDTTEETITPTTAISSKEMDEKAKREALIMERRAKLSKGSANINYENNAQREAMIKARRSELNK